MGATTISTVASIPQGTNIGLNDNAFHNAQYVTGAPSGGGPFTIPLDRPTCFPYPHLTSNVDVFSSVPSGVIVEGQGMLVTGAGTRYFNMGDGVRSRVDDVNFDASGGYLNAGEYLCSWDSFGYDCAFHRLHSIGQPVGIAIESGERCRTEECTCEAAGLPFTGTAGFYILDSANCDSFHTTGNGYSYGVYIGAEVADPTGCVGCTVRGGELNGNDIAGFYHEAGSGTRGLDLNIIGRGVVGGGGYGVLDATGNCWIGNADIKQCATAGIATNATAGPLRVVNARVGGTSGAAIGFYAVGGSTMYLDGAQCDATVATAVQVDATSSIHMTDNFDIDAAAAYFVMPSAGAATGGKITMAQGGGLASITTTGGNTFLKPSQARCNVLEVSGVLTSNALILPPGLPGLQYSVANLTTGAHTVEVLPFIAPFGGGFGYVIAQTKRSIGYGDPTVTYQRVTADT